MEVLGVVSGKGIQTTMYENNRGTAMTQGNGMRRIERKLVPCVPWPMEGLGAAEWL